MSILCPVCKNEAGDYNIPAQTYCIYKCSNCGLEYTHPIPTDSQLKTFYDNYFDIRADTTIVNLNASNNLKKLEDYGITKESKILDFGCGKGEFVNLAGENCYGLELGEVNIENIYNNLNDLPVKEFDCITLWGVLEHINDIRGIMGDLEKYLKEGGIFVITTVDAEGSIPYYYKPPEHLTYWTKKSLNILAELINCKIEDISPYTMHQFSKIYLDRLLSRTPKPYSETIQKEVSTLPEIVEVPTNEFFAVLRKI